MTFFQKLAFSAASFFAINALSAQPLVDIGLFNEPSGSNTFVVKVRPDGNFIEDYSGAVFTIKWPTAYGVTLSITSNTFGFSNVGQTIVGTDTYHRFSKTNSTTVNWTSGTAYPILTVQFSASNSGYNGSSTFCIVNDSWTGMNNGNHYEELNGLEKTGSIYQSCATSSFLLPLELLAFSARAAEKSIDLFWQTENEINFLGFEIERSDDGFLFEKIGFENGKGSGGRADYAFSDADVLAEKDYFYRLKMLDLDGRFTFSNIEKDRIDGVSIVKISPNPVRDFLNIEVEQGLNSAFSIFDATGKLLFSGDLNEKGQSQINVANLAEGFYVLRLFSSGGWAEDFRFLKQGN